MTIKLLLVDDDDLVRTGLRTIIQSDSTFEVVGEAADGTEAVQLAAETVPDVVLMDIQMPSMDGIEATRQISQAQTERPDGATTRVLVLTTFEQDEYVFQALKAGASGFMLKRTPRAELLTGIKAVAAGDGLLSPSITRRLIERFADVAPHTPNADTASSLASLTEREMEVLKLISNGLSNAEIADQLVVSDGTVKSHVKQILAKLGVRDRTQAVIFAYDAGLIRPRA